MVYDVEYMLHYDSLMLVTKELTGITSGAIFVALRSLFNYLVNLLNVRLSGFPCQEVFEALWYMFPIITKIRW